MLRDDPSSYCWLFAFPDTLVENAAHEIIDWLTAFGSAKGLMSDGPSHLKNETLRLVVKGLRVPRHFLVPFKPWSSGAVKHPEKGLL